MDLVVGPWGARMGGRWMPCVLGRGGTRAASDKREGDGATPIGVWRLTAAWWRADRRGPPGGCLGARPILPWLGWSEAPEDPAYNQPVRHPHGYGAERMRRADPLYDLVLVTDHNQAPVRPGAGSAIFVHRWRRPRHPTAGCVAFAPRDLAWIARAWTPRSRLIVRPRGGL